jgi:Holliday junction resolvasome RuvABC endonuclease subunit
VITIGVDPGMSGGLGIVGERGQIVRTLRPNWAGRNLNVVTRTLVLELVHGIRALALESYGPIYACIEEPIMFFGGAMMSKSAQAVAISAGVWLGVLGCAGVEAEMMPPRTWQAMLGIKYPKGTKSADKKRASIELVQRLWPGWPAMSDGEAEAVLIAQALRQKLMKEGRT